jgi:hypothetical protein
MLGRPADELQAASARILYADEETYERAGELAYGALRSSGKCHAQMQLQTRDGGLLWVDVSGAGLADGESIWVFVDIDALKRGEQAARHQALHEGQHRVKVVFEGMGHAEHSGRLGTHQAGGVGHTMASGSGWSVMSRRACR